MLKYLLLIPLWLFTQIATAQKQADLSESDILDVKAIAEDVILQYKTLLNIITDKKTGPTTTQKSIDENLAKLFYTPNVKIQDDLNGTPSNVVMADASKYLSNFDLYYTKTSENSPVKFSDIKITEPKQGNYLYMQASYNCTYTQVHNLYNTKLPNGKRTAELRIEKQNGDWHITIAGIVLGDNNATDETAEKQRLAKIEQERIAQEKEKEKAEQLKQQQAAAEAKQKAEAAAQKLAQKQADLSESDISYIKIMADDVISRYETLLNIIADKNTELPVIQTSINENLAKLFYTPNVKIQDDLNGTPSNVVMADASKYLNDFNLYYTKTSENSPVKFSDPIITEPKQGSYLYIQISYNCTYTQVHNLYNTKLPNGKRTAELRIEKQNGDWHITIAGIVLGDNKATDETAEKQRLAKIEQERIAQEKEKEKAAAEAKQKAEAAAQKLAQKQADKAKLDSMMVAPKLVTKPRQALPVYVAISYNALNTDAQKVQGKFGISAFSPSIGVFFSGYKQHKDATPTDYRNTEQLEIINYYLQLDADINGNTGNYTPTTYTSSGAKLTTFNWGVYAPVVRHVPAIGGSLWAMGGLAHLKGNVWDIYEGNLNNTDNFAPINTYTPDGTNQYAIDYTRLNKADIIVGLTYIRPYVQAEIGYNNLLRNFFVNVGANVPIKTKKGK